MVLNVKLQKIDDAGATFLAFPEEVLTHLGVAEGESVLLSKLEDGVIRISKVTPEFKRHMEVADDLIHRYQNALRALREAGD